MGSPLLSSLEYNIIIYIYHTYTFHRPISDHHRSSAAACTDRSAVTLVACQKDQNLRSATAVFFPRPVSDLIPILVAIRERCCRVIFSTYCGRIEQIKPRTRAAILSTSRCMSFNAALPKRRDAWSSGWPHDMIDPSCLARSTSLQMRSSLLPANPQNRSSLLSENPQNRSSPLSAEKESCRPNGRTACAFE